MPRHPDRAQLAAFAQGRLAPSEADRLEQHFDDCDTCCGVLDEHVPDTLIVKLREADGLGPSCAAPTMTFQGEHADASDEPIPAELLDHPRYRLGSLIGRGGMGAVFKAEHTLMERPVAVKVIAPRLLEQPGAVERFKNEVKAAAKLHHPNIVTAHDAEQVGSVTVLVMEYVDGRTLAEVLAERGPLPVAEGCEYVRQAAAGLAHAHGLGMVHRDVKPHNLMRTRDGGVKILDFGLARFANTSVMEAEVGGEGPSDVSLTRTGACMGTLDYMAPEQAANSREADHRADIYSLGCTLYHLLAGRVPFPGGNALDKLTRLRNDEPPSIAELRTSLPSDLSAVVGRMMAKRPEDRFASAEEVAAALLPFTESGRRKRSWRSGLAVAAGLFAAIGMAAAIPFIEYTPESKPAATDETPRSAPPRSDVPEGREVKRFVGHTGTVTSVAVSPDGRFIASGSGAPHADGTARIWDATTGKELHKITGHRGTVSHVQFLPDGTLLTVGGEDGTLRIWSTVSGNPVRKLDVQAEKLEAIAVLPGGKDVLLAGKEPVIRAWNLASGASSARMTHTGRAVKAIAISADGKRVASSPIGGKREIRIWDAATGKTEAEFTAPDDVMGLAFAPDGRHLLSIEVEGAIRVWNIDSGIVIRTLGKFGRGQTIALSPDGTRVATTHGSDRTIRIWDWWTGEELARCTGHADWVWSAVFTPDGEHLVTASGGDQRDGRFVPGSDLTVRVWTLPPVANLKSGESRRLFGLRGYVYGVANAPDNYTGYTADDAGIRSWDIEARSTPRFPSAFRTLALSADGTKVFAPCRDRAVRLFDSRNGAELAACRGHAAIPQSVALSANGQVGVSGGADGVLRVWDLPSGKERHALRGEIDHIRSIAVTQDGRFAVAGGHRPQSECWDLVAGRLVWTQRRHMHWVFSVAISPDDRFAAAANGPDFTVLLLDIKTGREVRRLHGLRDQVNAVAFSPDGSRVAAGGMDGRICVWDSATGTLLHTFPGHAAWVSSLRFANHGRQLLSGSNDGTVRVWNVPNIAPPTPVMTSDADRLMEPLGSSVGVNATDVLRAAFTLDGMQLITGHSDGSVRVFDSSNGAELRTLGKHRTNILALAVSWDGKQVLTGDWYEIWLRVVNGTAAELLPNPDQTWPAMRLAFAPDGKRAAVAGWTQWLQTWNLADRKVLAQRPGIPAQHGAVCWSPDGSRILSVGLDGAAAVRDSATLKPVSMLASEGRSLRDGAFSPDGRSVATCDERGAIRIHDAASGRELWSVRTDAARQSDSDRVAWIDDRRLLGIGAMGAIRIWNLDGMERPYAFHSPYVQAFHVSKDGRRLTTFGVDGTIRAWRLP